MKKHPPCKVCKKKPGAVSYAPSGPGEFCEDCWKDYTKKPDPREVAKKFLAYAFKDIDFDYQQLTDTERGLCTEKEFKALVTWVKGG